MRVLVTGATGHLGRALCARLAGAGHEPVAASRSGAVPPGARRSVAIDLGSDAAVAALRAELGPESALVHLAAWIPPRTAATTAVDRRQLLETNVLGTMRLLDAARAGVRAVVYASTFEVYGRPRSALIDEDHPTLPENDYGATKLSGEHHVRAFGLEERVRTVRLRMPAVYGPGETAVRTLPSFLRAVAAGRPPEIQGDGADLRDQLHVDDAARAVLCALSNEADGVFNVADGEPHSIRAIAEAAMRLAGLDGEPAHDPRARERLDFHLDIARARHELGFEPEWNLLDGMAAELAWLRLGGKR